MSFTDFSDRSLREYIELLSSAEPSPGGGSAAALAACLGVSLGEMVCRINAKKTKTNPQHRESAQRATRLSQIRELLVRAVTEDARVFERVSKLWSTKAPELEDALKKAFRVPMEIATLSADALTVAAEEIQLTSVHLVSDLSECGVLLLAAIKSARMNAEINLRAIKDREFASAQEAALNEIQSRAVPLSERLERAFNAEKKA